MRTLIIPCAGGRKIENKPIYIMRHPDRTLFLEKAIQGVNLKQIDRIVVVILQTDENEFGVSSYIKNELGSKYPNLEILFISEVTSGPAQTVYEAIKGAEIKGEIVIKDVISKVTATTEGYTNYISGINLSHWKKDIHDIRRKSFININEQYQVLDIIEKQIKSENISVGLYGFNDAEDYVFAYDRLNDKNYPIKNLYVSHVISYLIGYSGKVFHYINAEEFEEWGSGKNWTDLQKRCATYFCDVDFLIGLTSEESRSISTKKIIDSLEVIKRNGAMLIGFSSLSQDELRPVYDMLKDTALNNMMIISDCNLSTMTGILRSPEDVCRCLYDFE